MNNQLFKQTLADVFHDTKLHNRTQWLIVGSVGFFTVVAWAILLA